MDIRLLKKEEYVNAITLALHVFTTCNTTDFDDEGLGTFKSFIYNEELMDALTIWGAFCGNILVGILGMKEEENHLSMFFIHPDFQRQRIGQKLFNCMREVTNSGTITVNASTSAIPFYKKLGFKQLSEFTRSHGLVYVPMKLQ